jgi:Spy/CpxP family protein refolding chaperone
VKIMKNWLRTTLVTLFGFSLLSGLLAGCSRDHHADWSAQDVAKVRDRIAGKMDLDAAQTQKLDALIAQLQVLRSDIKGTSNDPRAGFATLITGDTFDRNGAQKLLDEKTSALQQDGPQVITALADFYDSLNPDQQRKLRQKLERHKSWFGH